MFCDGLCQDFIRLKVLRGKPRTLKEAYEITLLEQNLHKRFKIRSNCHYTSLPVPVANALSCKQFHASSAIQMSNPQTMKIDYSRSEKCIQSSCPIPIIESSVNTENVALDSKVRTDQNRVYFKTE